MKTPINDGFQQSDLDADGFKITNADLSEYAGENITWSSGTFNAVAGGGDGTIILDGSGPPTVSVGSTDDYYVDTVGQDLYGPKGDVSDPYLAAEHAVPDATVPTSTISGGAPLEVGSQVQCAVAGIVTGVRYYRPSSSPTSRTVNLWTSGGALLKTATVADDGGGTGWIEVLFSTPYVVAAGVTLVVSYGVASGDYSRRDGTSFPQTNGGNVSLLTSQYTTTVGAFPSVSGGASYFFPDIIFRADDTDVWPVAVPGGGGGTASMTSNEISTLVQTASAAASTADVKASNAITLANLANDATNTVSARAVSISAELVSLMNSADAALSSRVTSVAGIAGGGSVTSTELSVAKYMLNTTQTDTDYTLVLGDARTTVKMSSSSPHNLTVPLNTSVAFPTGTQIVIEQAGTGAVTIVATGGVTLQGGPLTMTDQYATTVLIKQATDTWLVSGAIDVTSMMDALSAQVASADAALSLRVTSVAGLSGGGGGGSATSAEVYSIVQGYSTFSIGATSVLLSAGSPPEEFATGSTGGTILMPDVTTLVLGKQYLVKNRSTATVNVNSSGGNLIVAVTTGGAAVLTCILITGTTAASWDYTMSEAAAVNTVSARVVSVSAELGSLIQIASLAATSADTHANTVSARAVSISNELGSLLASASAALNARITSVGANPSSVTSQEVSVLVQTASAAATSADSHANTVSLRAVSISAELASLIASGDAALSTRINTASALAGTADTHANTVSARAVSISAELASLVQIASLAATSADGHANTVSVRAVSISAEVVSLMNSADAALSTRINTASALGTTADTHANTVSVRAVSISAELASLVQIASLAATSADGHANTVSVRAVSISAELASLMASADAALSTRINTASALGTTADTHANTVSARAVSISNELGSLLASASLALETHINAVSAAGVTGGASVTSNELASLVQIASLAATSADTHANTVSVRAVSISNELGSLLASASTALNARITSVAGLVGGGSATSAEIYSIVQGYSTFAASTVSVALSAGSPPEEFITGTAAQPIVMPDVTTLVLGKQYLIKNNSTASATVNSSGGNLIVTVPAGSAAVLTCILTTGTTAASWDYTMAGSDAANVVSARLVSVSAELVSLMASADAALSSRITSADTAVSTQAASQNNVISARVVSASAELVSLMNSADAALSLRATSADTHANTVSTRVVSVSAELVSLLTSTSAALIAADRSTSIVIKADIASVSAVLATRTASVSAELYSVMQLASQNAQPNAYSIVLADAGKHIFHDSATPHTYIIPPNSTAAFPIGTMITIVNNTGGGTVTLSILTDTLRRGDGTAGTGQRTIIADSVATVIKTKTTEWFVTGKFT